MVSRTERLAGYLKSIKENTRCWPPFAAVQHEGELGSNPYVEAHWTPVLSLRKSVLNSLEERLNTKVNEGASMTAVVPMRYHPFHIAVERAPKARIVSASV
jgi:hypothetical protein